MDNEQQGLKIEFTPTQFTHFLSRIISGFILAYVIGQFSIYCLNNKSLFGFVPMFDLDGENNFPAVFSTMQMYVASVLLAVITYAKRKEKGTYVYHWAFMAFLFFFLGCDELMSIHERVSHHVREYLHPSGVLKHAWVIPYLIAAAFFVLAYIKFLWHLSPRIRYLMITSGFVYVLGAAGFELIGLHYADQHGMEAIGYKIFVLIEESLEMIGIMMFIHVLLIYLESSYGGLRLNVISATAKAMQGQAGIDPIDGAEPALAMETIVEPISEATGYHEQAP